MKQRTEKRKIRKKMKLDHFAKLEIIHVKIKKTKQKINKTKKTRQESWNDKNNNEAK